MLGPHSKISIFNITSFYFVARPQNILTVTRKSAHSHKTLVARKHACARGQTGRFFWNLTLKRLLDQQQCVQIIKSQISVKTLHLVQMVYIQGINRAGEYCCDDSIPK